MLEAVFSTIPLVWELYDRDSGQVLESVYAELRVEKWVVTSAVRSLEHVSTTKKPHHVALRLVDQGGAVYIEFGRQWDATLEYEKKATVILPDPCFTLTEA